MKNKFSVRKYYLDNIRWMTVVLVVIYHVIYMFNGIVADGVIGPFCERQYQDSIQYILYPWFMMLLFIVSGMCARYYLEKHTVREFVRTRTQKLLIPSTVEEVSKIRVKICNSTAIRLPRISLQSKIK